MDMKARFYEKFDSAEITGQLYSLRRKNPEMGMMALFPESESSKVEPLQQICRELSIPLTGAIFPSLIVNSQFHDKGILFFLFDKMPPYLLQDELGSDESTDRLTEEISSRLSDNEQTTLFLIFDAMVPNIATMLEQIYLGLADRVHYMGVNAGSETFQPIPCLFDSEKLIQNGVLALMLQDHEGAVLEHGYQAPSHMVAATATEGNRVISIDWRPAFEVYSERIQEQYGVEITRENFYQYSVHFPFGIIRADDEVLVRIPVALEDDGSLFCVGEVPANSVLTLLEAPKERSLHTTEKLSQRLAGLPSGRDILLFYCAGRRMHLGEASCLELEALQQCVGDRQLFGALSLGEIGSSRQSGYPLFHNATLVCSGI